MHVAHLIPPPDMAPPGIGGLSPEDRIRLWAEMVDEGDRLVYDGFRRRHDSEEAARRDFLAWLDRRAIDATRAKVRMLTGRHPGG